VVSHEAPSDFAQDDGLDYLAMPKDMETYRPPQLPEPEEIASQAGAVQALHQVLGALQQVCRSGGESGSKGDTGKVSLAGLLPAELTLINQVLGEGEVSAQVLGPQGTPVVHIQESVFAGVWRVIEECADGSVQDQIELGAIPEVLRRSAHEDGLVSTERQALPAELTNVPSVLVELEDQRTRWQRGDITW